MHGSGEARSACIVFVGKPEGKKSLGRRMRRWEDNVRTDLREIWREVVWTGFVWLMMRTSGEAL
jgi:hypothetical protein